MEIKIKTHLLKSIGCQLIRQVDPVFHFDFNFNLSNYLFKRDFDLQVLPSLHRIGTKRRW
jgi:hypothetical protein